MKVHTHPLIYRMAVAPQDHAGQREGAKEDLLVQEEDMETCGNGTSLD